MRRPGTRDTFGRDWPERCVPVISFFPKGGLVDMFLLFE
jgi:hypothetical protein